MNYGSLFLGLCNVSLFIVKDIRYDLDDTDKHVPNVPIIAWFEFDEGTYLLLVRLFS